MSRDVIAFSVYVLTSQKLQNGADPDQWHEYRDLRRWCYYSASFRGLKANLQCRLGDNHAGVVASRRHRTKNGH